MHNAIDDFLLLFMVAEFVLAAILGTLALLGRFIK